MGIMIFKGLLFYIFGIPSKFAKNYFLVRSPKHFLRKFSVKTGNRLSETLYLGASYTDSKKGGVGTS